MANLILNAENAPLRSWGGSAVLGVSPTRYCRGFPHSLLHQDNVKHLNG
ncbi:MULTISPECIES: hypothetical protein [Moorena]|nr:MULTISPECIES: hypothetical protein [Moorena]NEQ05682.1 hypothetical protein [Moorena sp. SIO4E2]NET65935.1 hypothetical protein [Moorena sp. SIO1G6]